MSTNAMPVRRPLRLQIAVGVPIRVHRYCAACSRERFIEVR
jgi:hypothetical protein